MELHKKNLEHILITGGAGFIGGAIIRNLLEINNCIVFNIDKLSYASDLSGIKVTEASKNRHFHLKLDLRDINQLRKCIEEIKPEIIIHAAAETHVDRSIIDPSIFISSNIIGTFNLLEVSKNYWNNLPERKKETFRFHHISTDEVFGSLAKNEFFNESSNYAPRSPYAASKASSDHLVNSWHNTFKLPTLITNCSNNFGPFQFPEKLIPLTINAVRHSRSIPIYGDGKQIRDWIYVDDHISGVMRVLQSGTVGESYNIGSNNEVANIDLVEMICDTLDTKLNNSTSSKQLIEFVRDRPGHDRRYAIDSSKIRSQLGWIPSFDIKAGIDITVDWYLANEAWLDNLSEKAILKNRFTS